MSSSPPAIRSYRLDPNAFAATTKRRIAKRLAWVLPLIFILVIGEFVVMGKNSQSFVDALPIALSVSVLALAFGLFRAFRLQLKNGKPAWDSYDLTMSENVIMRHVINLPPIEILRPEVTRVVEVRGQGLTVATNDRHRFVFVPEELLGYDEVRARLAQWRALDPPLVRNRLGSIVWSIALIGAWIGTGAFRDIRVAMASAAVLVLVGGITIRETLNTKVADNRAKAASLGSVCFMLLAPVARLVLYFGFHMNVGWPNE